MYFSHSWPGLQYGSQIYIWGIQAYSPAIIKFLFLSLFYSMKNIVPYVIGQNIILQANFMEPSKRQKIKRKIIITALSDIQ